MPAAEPHPRRRVALRRALSVLLAASAAIVGPGASGAAGQILPTSTTAPATTSTEAPVETTTTEAQAEPEPEETTTTTRVTGTTARPTTTAESDAEDDEDAGVVTEEDVAEDAGTVADDEPAETTSTARDLLVSGDGSEGAQSTTTSSTTVVEVAADEDDALDEQAQIWLIVAGLVLVALLIGVWTWRYWVRTRPAPPDEGLDDTTVFHRG